MTLILQLSGATILFGSLFGVARFLGAVRATKRVSSSFPSNWQLLMLQVHSEMLSSVLCAKMSFFTKNRAGSIVQRFGGDLVSSKTGCADLLLIDRRTSSRFRRVWEKLGRSDLTVRQITFSFSGHC
jgi:hypothetical protein